MATELLSVPPPRQDAAIRFARWMLAAMLILPFLVPWHYEPIGSFHAEWLAALLGLLAGVGLMSPQLWHEKELPGIVLLPLGLLALVLMQLSVGIENFPQQTQLFALYLIWAALLVVLGNRLASRLGLAALCDGLAAALLAGALLAAVVALLDRDPVDFLRPLLFVDPRRHTLVGNIAQSNHFANQLWIGMAAAIYLGVRRHLRGPLALAALTVLMAVAVLTASRSIIAYLLAFVLMALIARRRWPGPASRTALRLTLALLPLYLLCEAGASAAGALGWSAVETPAGKWAAAGLGSIRQQLFAIAWRSFVDAPLLGHGVGSFPRQSLAIIAGGGFADVPQAAENAHNLIAETLSDLGAPAALGLVAGVAFWLWRGLRHAGRRGGDDALAFAWIVAVLAVEAIHSQLEYPLWYSFFLGPTALLLGAGDARPLHFALAARARFIAGSILICGAAVLAGLRFDYVRLERAVNPWLAGQARHGTWNDLLPFTREPQRQSLFYPYLCVSAMTRLAMPPQPLPAALQVSDCAMRVMPVDLIVYRRGLVLAYAGDAEAAKATWRLALDAYPRAAAEAVAELRTMDAESADSPLRPLLEMARARLANGVTTKP